MTLQLHDSMTEWNCRNFNIRPLLIASCYSTARSVQIHLAVEKMAHPQCCSLPSFRHSLQTCPLQGPTGLVQRVEAGRGLLEALAAAEEVYTLDGHRRDLCQLRSERGKTGRVSATTTEKGRILG